ncbi:MAG: hypothetical protein NTV34_20025 [Proteobacteria bacterium]|nr:hypothetical protein [Pseudomonadota bacterium]
MTVVVLTTLAVILCAALAVLWARKIGPLRGLGAALCRLMWLLPIVWTLNPETITEQLPSILVQQPIHILLDDSVSMRGGRVNGSLSDELKTSIKDIEETCQRFGCLPKIVRLSELRSETAKGFTPLSAAL